MNSTIKRLRELIAADQAAWEQEGATLYELGDAAASALPDLLEDLESLCNTLDSIECMAAGGPDALGMSRSLSEILAIIKETRADLLKHTGANK